MWGPLLGCKQAESLMHSISENKALVWVARAGRRGDVWGLGTGPSAHFCPAALHAYDPVFKRVTHSPKMQVSRGGAMVGG